MRITFLHFYCSSPSQGAPPRMFFYNNKILPLADCSPNVTFSTVSAPVCQKTYIFHTNFNNSGLGPISSVLHRCARITFPMVWRTRRFVAVKNVIYFHCFFNNFTFCYHATFKILALTASFGNLFVLHRFHGSSSRPVAMNHCHVLSIFARKANVFSMFSFEHC